MALSAAQANALVADLLQDARPEWARLRRFVAYARGSQKLPWLPDDAATEYRDIARKSATNWLDLVVSATTQGLYVDGFGEGGEDSVLWHEVWQPNALDASQHALHRAVEVTGYGYVLAMPSSAGVWVRPESSTNCYARYDDPSDEWPVAAVRVVKRDRRYQLFDDEAVYDIDDGSVSVVEHGVDRTPVVMMRSGLDLLGTPMGQIEPMIPVQDRITDATFTLQMVAKYGAFPQRWIAGIDVPSDADGNPLPPQIKAYVDHILMASDTDTKFGQFAAADLTQYVAALEAHIRHLAAVTQTPPHFLLGALVNLSAEALAAAEAGLQRKIAMKRDVLGEGYEQMFRLTGTMLGYDDLDSSAQVRWRDVESRSLAQTADAMLKLAQIGVPVPMLLEMMPGWTQQDVERAVSMLDQGTNMAMLMDQLVAGQTSRV